MRTKKAPARPQIISSPLLSLSFSLTLFWSLGCSVHSMTGSVISEYTVDHLIPHVLSTDDLDMACEMGSSMGPFLLSFERVTDPLDQAAVPTFMTSAMCAEKRVWQAEVRALLAERARQVPEMRDALIVQRREHAVTASRYFAAYSHMKKLLGEGCERLDGPQTELTMLLGLMGGILAVQHDRASGVQIGVPTNIPVQVARQAECLDNEKWWGVPQSMRGAVWAVVPGSAPKELGDQKEKILSIIEEQLRIADQSGVRVAYSIYGLTAIALGDRPRVEQLLRRAGLSFTEQKANPSWRVLDQAAFEQLQAISDRYLIKDRGYRTQHELHLFSDWKRSEEKPDAETSADTEDDLLDGLDDE